MRLIFLIISIFFLMGCYDRYITERKDMETSPCFEIKKVKILDKGMKEIIYKDTCRQD